MMPQPGDQPLDLLGGLLSGSISASNSNPVQPLESAELKCSRKGCTESARWKLEWNNPKIHVPERRKTWLACQEHLEYLKDFLTSRFFLKDIVPVETAPKDSNS